MTDRTPLREADHERIWLEPRGWVDPSVGRQWCQDKVWPEEDCVEEPTEYIQADLARTPPLSSPEQIERVARAIYEADCALDPIAPREPVWGRGGYTTSIMLWHGLAKAAIAALFLDEGK